MIELNASVTAYQKNEVRYNTYSQQKAISISDDSSSKYRINGFSEQENQIIDDVNISNEAEARLKDERDFALYFQAYVNYLRNEGPQNVVLVEVNGDDFDVRVDYQSAEASASISYSETTATQTDISARFTDDGQLIDLEINQIRVSERELNVELQSRILDLSIQA